VKGPFTVQTESEPSARVVRPIGELDLAVTDILDAEMQRVEATESPSIVLDLGGLRFVDSSGIRLLLSVAARSRANGDRLRMLPGSGAVQRVLELTGADEALPLTA